MRLNPFTLAIALALSFTPLSNAQMQSEELPTFPLPFTLQETVHSAPEQPSTRMANQHIASTLTFADMGSPKGLTLSGQQMQNGLSFTLPGDAVITTAHITLHVQANRTDVRGENVQLILNGQPLGAVSLDKLVENNGVWSLDVPASMIATRNNLSVQLKTGDEIINDAWSCQRALPADYSVTLKAASALNYEGLWLNVRKTLATFPRPFFESQQTKPAPLTIAFAQNPDADVLTASAIVASWFGTLTTGALNRFDVQYDTLPAGNGIVIGKPGQRVGGIEIPENGGATLQLIDNPNNPAYKLLIISGQNAAQLRQAAWRLTLPDLPDSDMLEVPTLSLARRNAYDAPRWISTRQPVALHSLVDSEEALIARGVRHDENRVLFRTAPDLFLWDGDAIPLRLHYSVAEKSWLDDRHAFLNVSLNGEFLKRLPVTKEGRFAPLLTTLGLAQRQQSAGVNIDPRAIRGSNALGFWFGLKPKENAPCSALVDETALSRIDGKSTLDLSGTWHFGKLPNLAWLSGAMFPFTRHADLSHTRVVMPVHPTEQETSVLLTLMAQAGRDTGVSAHYLQLFTGLPGADALAESDILAIGSLERGELLSTLLHDSAFTLQQNRLEVIPASLLKRALSLLSSGAPYRDKEAAQFLSDNHAWRGMLSTRSPWDPQRVVVLATASDTRQLDRLPEDLMTPAFISALNGDFTAINDAGDIHNWRVGEQFASGNLPGYLKVLWYASEYCIGLVLLVCLAAALSGPALFNALRRHAHQRLQDKSGK